MGGDLDKSVRTLLLLIDAIILAVIFIRHIYTSLTERPSHEQVATEVEQTMPEFRSRLIASTQMAGKGQVPPRTCSSAPWWAKPRWPTTGFNSVVSSDGS